jgi:hypothetical protein
MPWFELYQEWFVIVVQPLIIIALAGMIASSLMIAVIVVFYDLFN